LTFAGAAVDISESDDTDLTGTSTANSLVLVSGGAISDTASNLTVTGNAHFTAGGGGSNITLGDAGSTATFGSLTFAGAAVDISETDDTDLTGTSTANSLVLVSGGAISDTASNLTVTGNAHF